MDSEYRPLTAEEHQLLAWLLGHEAVGSAELVAQLNDIRVRKGCSCGCPGIEFDAPLHFRDYSPTVMEIYCDGWSEGEQVNLRLTLSELEVSAVEGFDHPFGLPPLSSLRIPSCRKQHPGSLEGPV
jgi:hypothetical protein